MRFLNDLFRKPRSPDLTFAAKGFYPIALIQLNDVQLDLHAAAHSRANTMLEAGCSVEQALSAQWGGVTAIGQDLTLFVNNAHTFDGVVEEIFLESGKTLDIDPKSLAESRYLAAATLFLSHILADAPNEFERFLKYVGHK